MKWQFKNSKYATMLRTAGLSTNKIYEAINAHFEKDPNGSEVVFYSPLIKFCMSPSLFKSVRKYVPGEWNPFPEVLPPVVGERYIVTIYDQETQEYKIDLRIYYDSGWDYSTCSSKDAVIAFRSYPKPYKPKVTRNPVRTKTVIGELEIEDDGGEEDEEDYDGYVGDFSSIEEELDNLIVKNNF